jgi:hypothetical protein
MCCNNKEWNPGKFYIQLMLILKSLIRLCRRTKTTMSMFGWLVADGWCWFVLREEYCCLVAGGWFVLREKYYWVVADKPTKQAE